MCGFSNLIFAHFLENGSHEEFFMHNIDLIIVSNGWMKLIMMRLYIFSLLKLSDFHFPLCFYLLLYHQVCCLFQVRDELEQLLDDDDDMADLYLSRKLAGSSCRVSGSGAASWFPGSPTIGSKISRASRASAVTNQGNENDVEELEMLLEVIKTVF